MPEIQITGRKIGSKHLHVVFVEISFNHEGSIDTTIKMADPSIDAWAEIVKHQTHIVEDKMSNEVKFEIPGHKIESIYEIIARCTLSESNENPYGAGNSGKLIAESLAAAYLDPKYILRKGMNLETKHENGGFR
jgi:hypothetical protein